MIQPAFGVICDICRNAAPDPYLADGMTVCEGCWDPFGTFDHVSERRSRVRVDGVARVMLLPHLKMRAAQGAGAGNSNDSSGLTTLNELDWSSDHG